MCWPVLDSTTISQTLIIRKLAAIFNQKSILLYEFSLKNTAMKHKFRPNSPQNANTKQNYRDYAIRAKITIVRPKSPVYSSEIRYVFDDACIIKRNPTLALPC